MTGAGPSFGIALAIATILLFSLKAIFTKFAYANGMDALSMLGLRMTLALPFFLGVALWLRRRRLPTMSRRDLAAVCTIGLLGYYLSSGLDFIGLMYLSASMERLLLFTYPTMVVLMSAIFFKRPIGARDAVSLATTYFGVALVVGGGATNEMRLVLIGALCVVASAFLYSIYLVFGYETIRRVGATRFTAYCMIAAAVPAIAQWMIIRPGQVLELSAGAWFWGAMLTIFSTTIPIFMQSAALRRIGANRFAILGALGPVLTILIGYAFLGERMTFVQWAGALLVVLGVMIVTVKN